MTPSQQEQQERMFLISESELNSTAERYLHKGERHRIQSRPAPAPCPYWGIEHSDGMEWVCSKPAPSPLNDVDCNTCLFGEQCRPLAYIPPCYNHGPDSPARAASQAREDATLAENTRVLNELMFFLDGYRPTKRLLSIFTKIQSLRIQQEAQR